MALPPLASIDDMEIRLAGGIPDDEEARAEACLEDASALVRTEAGNKTYATGENLQTLDPAMPPILATITLASAIRAFDNPDGIRQESLGPASFTYSNASTGVWITKDERRLIRRAAGVGGLRAYPTTRGDDGLRPICAPTTYGDGGPAGAPIPVADPYSIGDPT